MKSTKNLTKVVVWLVAALVLVSLLCAVSLLENVPAGSQKPAQAATVTWGGGASTSWSGSGTSGSPYLIQSGEDLKLLSNNVNAGNTYSGVYFRQTVNINLNNYSWTPIGTADGTTDFSSSKKFAGIYDGNQKSINNLNINTSTRGQGLFGYVTGQINNLMLLNGSVTGSQYIYGAFAAVLQGSMSNCINYGVAVNLVGTGGGLVGIAWSGSSITNCVNAAQVYLSARTNVLQLGQQSSTDGIQIGGIAGHNNGNISRCANYGYINANADIHVGGLAGWNLSAGTITNSYNCGDVNGSKDRGASIACKNENSANPTVSYCYNTGYVSSKNDSGQTGNPINFGNRNYNNWFNSAQTAIPSGWNTSYWTVGAPANKGWIYHTGSPILWGAATLADQSVAALGWNGISPGIMLGNGSSYPFVVYSGADLASLGDLVRGGQNLYGYTITVLFDINMNNQSYTPIGSLTYNGSSFSGAQFRGIFDGNNKTISGISITRTDLDGLGLFSWVGGGGQIRNLTLAGSINASSGSTVKVCGGFAGVSEGSITNCRNNMSINCNALNGGIVGFLSSGGSITNCYNTNSITFSGTERDISYPGQSSGTDGSKIGGLVGVTSGVVSKSWNTGTVSSSAGIHLGGITGWLSFEGRIWDCYNAGTVNCSDRAGGIAGKIDDKSGYSPTLTRCFNFVPVTSGADAGTSAIANFGDKSKITNCYAKSQLSSGVTQIPDGAAEWTNNSLAWTLNTVAGGGNSLVWAQGASYPVIASGNAVCKITNGGASNGTISLQTYCAQGSTVNVTATPSTGYKFSKITVGSTDYAATSFTMPAGDVTVTGTFVGITYTIRYNSNIPSAPSTYDYPATYNTAYTYAPASTFTYSGYTMQFWNSAADGTGTNYTLGGTGANLSSTQGAVVNLYAVWSFNNPTVNAATSYSTTYNTGAVLMTCSAAHGNPSAVLTYKWQSSSDGTNFSDIAGTNSTSYSFTPSAVGTYYFRAAAMAAHNGNQSGYITSSTITVTVSPKAITSSDITITGLSASYVYTGTNINPVLTLKDLGTNMTLNTHYSVSYTSGYNKDVATGGKISVTGTGNYSGSKELTYTITPAPVSVTPAAFSKTYGEADPPLTQSFPALGSDIINVVYTREAGENGGTYDLLTIAHAAPNPNYTLSFAGNSNLNKFTILRYVVYVTPQTFSKIYGSADPALTQSVPTGVDDETIVVVFTREAGHAAGSYDLLSVAAQTPNPDYTFYINGATGLDKFTILPYALTVNPSPMSKTYGQTEPALTEIIPGVGAETLSVTYTREAGENADSYAYLTVYTANTNYTVSLFAEATNKFTIFPYNVQITASLFTKTYGDGDPALQETKPTGVNGESVTVIYYREEGEDAKSYNLTAVVQLSENTNYTVSFALGGNVNKFRIDRRPVTLTADNVNRTYGDALVLSYTYMITGGNLIDTDTLTGTPACPTLIQAAASYPITAGSLTDANNPNYAITFINGSYVIAPYAVSIIPPEATYYKYYADGEPDFTYIASGLEGETFATTFTRETGEDAGFYDIVSVATASTNYTVSLANGAGTDKFEILRRPVTVYATATGHTYGGTDVSPLPYTTQNLPDGYTLSGALERAPGVAADTYEIYQGTLTDANNTNYIINYIGADYTIYRRPITLTGVGISKTYGDELVTEYSYVISNGSLVGDDTLIGAPACPTLIQKAGSYPITRGSLTNDNNPDYNISYVNGTYVIAKYILQVTPDAFGKTYGDDDPPLTQTVDGIRFGGIPEQVGVVFTRASGAGVGPYDLTGVTSTDDNYGAQITAGAGTGKFTIVRRDITIAAIPTGHVFGNASVSLTYTKENVVGDDIINGSLSREAGTVYRESGYEIRQGTVTNDNNPNYNIIYIGAIYMIYKRPITITAPSINQIFGDAEIVLSFTAPNTVAGYPISGTVAREPGTDVGEYPILSNTVTAEANPNYELTYVLGTYNILQRAVSIYADNKASHYGDPELALTYQATNVVAACPLVGELQRDRGGELTVGMYNILAGTLTPEANPNYAITFYEGVYTITRRPVAVTPSLFQKTYGEEDPVLTETLEGVYGMTYTVTYRRSQASVHLAGSYDLEAIIHVSDDNYQPSIATGAGIGKFVINRYNVTVTAESASHTYGEEDAPLTYTHTELAYDETSLIGELSRESGIHWQASGYAILQGTLDNEHNPNYNITFVSAVYTINKRAVSLRADNIFQVYGSAPSALTYTLTQGSLVGADTFAGSLTREPGTTVRAGGYVISQGSLNNTDYEITFVTGIYTITPAPLSVTAHAKTITYGEEDVPLTYTLNTPMYGSDILTGALTREPGSNANEEGYNILLGTLGNPNYAIDFVSAKYIILRRHITITAKYCTQIYGDPAAAMTYTVTEGSLARDNDLFGALTREPGENYHPNGYAILQGTVDNAHNPNYMIEYVGSVYMIEKRPITVTAVDCNQIYGEAPLPLEYSITAGSLREGDILTGTLVRDAITSVGTTLITAGSLTNANNQNYNIRFINGNYNILPRPITVTADDISIIYGEEDVPLTYTITEGSLIGDDTLQYSPIRLPGSTVGSYEIRIGSLYHSNYAITFVKGTYTVLRRPLYVEIPDFTVIFGYPVTLTPAVVGLVQGDTLVGQASLDYQGTGSAPAGTYAIVAGTITNAANPNYDILFTGGTCTVLQRHIRIILSNQNVEFGSAGLPDQNAYDVFDAETNARIANSKVRVVIARTPGNAIGNYPLTATCEDPNYVVSFTFAVYSINRIATYITVGASSVEMAYSGIPYIIPASTDSPSPLRYSVNGQTVQNSFVDVGTHTVVITAAATDVYAAPEPVTVTVVIKPVTLSAEQGELRSADGFRSGASLRFTEAEPAVDTSLYLTRTEAVVASYNISVSGDSVSGSSTLRLKVPAGLESESTVKLLVTEGGVTRVLRLSPSADGYVSFEISGDASVTFVTPIKTTNVLTILLIVGSLLGVLGFMFSLLKSSRR